MVLVLEISAREPDVSNPVGKIDLGDRWDNVGIFPRSTGPSVSDDFHP